MSDTGRHNRGRSRSHETQQQPPRRPGTNETADRNPPEADLPGARRATVRSRDPADNQSARDATVPRSSSSNVPRSLPLPARDEAIAGPSATSYPNESRSVTRPPCFSKTGTQGQPVEIKSNYFQLIQKMSMHLLHYRVDFNPEIEHTWVKCGLLRPHQQVLGKYSFDGSSLFNVKRLSQPLELTSTRNSDGSNVVITIKLVGEIHKEDQEYLQVMNIIFRRCLTMLNLVLMNRNYFDPAAEEKVQNYPITIWPGYKTTIDRRENSEHLLLTEVIHKFIRQDTAYNVMDGIRRKSMDDLQNRIKAEMAGKIVMTIYNRKTYRVDDVDFDKNPSSTFHHRRGDRLMTYAEYYHTQYQLDIINLTQPLLVSRPSRRDVNRGDSEPIYLIPELCGMTGLSEDQRKNFTTMKEVSRITRLGPDLRVKALLNFRQRLEKTPAIQTELSSWGIQFSNNLITCKGRVLPTNKIFLGKQKSVPVAEGDWSRSMHNATMAVSTEMKSWVVLLPTSLYATVRSFVKIMKEVGAAQGFDIPEPKYVTLDNDRMNNYVEKLEDELSQKDYSMVMCVLRNNRTDVYNVIKKLTLSSYGISSQVITGRVIQGDDRKLKSVATKVMTQIACKLGAEPWRVDLPNKPWMIVGYDTYHDARQRRAVGAFVASINSTYTRFYSSVKRHPANEDISSNFKDFTLCSLKAYYRENNQRVPEKIIVYRDGVGVGDLNKVTDIEIEAIKLACEEARIAIKKPDWNPGIAYIIVSKRINTRFFTNSPRAENPRCGTVVDNVVTHSHRFNFYLVSQKVNQGTVSPTMYDVIHDNTGITPDNHQSLAYALTHLYYNWAGTLRIPAPIQYAHKLAYLVGENLCDQPHESLARFPYYL